MSFAAQSSAGTALPNMTYAPVSGLIDGAALGVGSLTHTNITMLLPNPPSCAEGGCAAAFGVNPTSSPPSSLSFLSSDAAADPSLVRHDLMGYIQQTVVATKTRAQQKIDAVTAAAAAAVQQQHDTGANLLNAMQNNVKHPQRVLSRTASKKMFSGGADGEDGIAHVKQEGEGFTASAAAAAPPVAAAAVPIAGQAKKVRPAATSKHADDAVWGVDDDDSDHDKKKDAGVKTKAPKGRLSGAANDVTRSSSVSAASTPATSSASPSTTTPIVMTAAEARIQRKREREENAEKVDEAAATIKKEERAKTVQVKTEVHEGIGRARPAKTAATRKEASPLERVQRILTTSDPRMVYNYYSFINKKMRKSHRTTKIEETNVEGDEEEDEEDPAAELLFLVHTLPTLSNPFKGIVSESIDFLHQLTASAGFFEEGDANGEDEEDDNANSAGVADNLDGSGNVSQKAKGGSRRKASQQPPASAAGGGNKRDPLLSIPTLWFAAALAIAAHPAFIDHASLAEAVFNNTIEVVSRFCRGLYTHMERVSLHNAALMSSAAISTTTARSGRGSKNAATSAPNTDQQNPQQPLPLIPPFLSAMLDQIRLVLRYFAITITTAGLPTESTEYGLRMLLPLLLSTPSFGAVASETSSSSSSSPSNEAIQLLSKYLSDETILLCHSYWAYVQPNSKHHAIRDVVNGLRWCRELSLGTFKVIAPSLCVSPATAAATKANAAALSATTAGAGKVSTPQALVPTTTVIGVMPLTIAVIAAVQAQPMVAREDKASLLDQSALSAAGAFIEEGYDAKQLTAFAGSDGGGGGKRGHAVAKSKGSSSSCPLIDAIPNSNNVMDLGRIILERVSENSHLWIQGLLKKFFSPETVGGGSGLSGTDPLLLATLEDDANAISTAAAVTTTTAAERNYGIVLITRLADDLGRLIGVPQFPAADTLLKALIFNLGKYYLRGEGIHHHHHHQHHQHVSSSSKAATSPSYSLLFERFRSAAIDILGKLAVTLHAFKDPARSVVAGVTTDGAVVDKWSILLQKAEDAYTKRVIQQIANEKRRENGGAADDSAASSAGGAKKKKKDPAGDGGRGGGDEQQQIKIYHPTDISLSQKIHCSLFNNLNRRAQLCGSIAEGLLWYGARQGHVSTWRAIGAANASSPSASSSSRPPRSTSGLASEKDSTMSRSGGATTTPANNNTSASLTFVGNGISSAVGDALIVDDRESEYSAASTDCALVGGSSSSFLSATSSGGSDRESVAALASQILFLSCNNKRSVVHAEASETLLVALLSVFKSTSSQQQQEKEGTSSSSSSAVDVSRKKAILHLASLLELYPQLTKACWYAVRDAMSDGNSSRMREASIPLLVTLVCRGSRGRTTPAATTSAAGVVESSDSGSAAQNSEQEDVALCALSALVRLLSDPSDSIVSKAVTAVEQILFVHSRQALAAQRSSVSSHSPLRPFPFSLLVRLDDEMVSFMLSKLLDLYAADVEGKHRGLITTVFYRRWFAVGSGNEECLLLSSAASPQGANEAGDAAQEGDGSSTGLVGAGKLIAATSATAAKQMAKNAKMNPTDALLSNCSIASAAATSSSASSAVGILAIPAAAMTALPPDLVIEEISNALNAMSSPPFEVSATNHPLPMVLCAIANAVGRGGGGGSASSSPTTATAAATAAESSSAATAAASSTTVATSAAKGAAKKAIAALLSLPEKEKKAVNSVAATIVSLIVASLQRLLKRKAKAEEQQQAPNTTAATPKHTGSDGDEKAGGSSLSATLSHQISVRAGVLRLFANANASWLLPTVEPLLEMCTAAVDPTRFLDEAFATLLLHTCLAFKAIFQQVQYGIAASNGSQREEQVIGTLTNVMSKFAGLHQQRVLAACVGAICAAIEPGSVLPTGRSGKYRLPSLKHAYSLMNNCYLRTVKCLTSMGTGGGGGGDAQQQNTAFALSLRFIFILSEFLRCYPWNNSFPSLEAPEVTAPFQNALLSSKARTAQALLAASGGKATAGIISANIYELLMAGIQRCGGEGASSSSLRTRMLVVVLRAVGSLCILQPADYFRRCERLLHEGLRGGGSGGGGPSGDVTCSSPPSTTLQIQTLSLISDFLREEERRVTLATVGGGGEAGDSSATAQSSSSSAIVDYNSGMATWLLQQFHQDVLQLMLAPEPSIRALAFEVVELALEQGLLAPSVYAEALVAATTLSATSAASTAGGDASSSSSSSSLVSVKSARLLTQMLERHEDAVIGKVGRSLVRCFEACLVSDPVMHALTFGLRCDQATGDDASLSSSGADQVMARRRSGGDSPLQRAASAKSTNAATTVAPQIKRKRGITFELPCVASAVFRSAFTPATDVDPSLSCLAQFFACLSGGSFVGASSATGGGSTVLLKYRKRRELLLTTIIRYVHQEVRLSEIISATTTTTTTAKTLSTFGASSASHSSPLSFSSGNAAATPFNFIIYLCGALALLPLSIETEALAALRSIRGALDVLSEASEQSLKSLVDKIGTLSLIIVTTATTTATTTAASTSTPSSADRSSSDSTSTSHASVADGEQRRLASLQQQLLMDVAKAVAAIGLIAVKTYIKREFGISPAKLQKWTERARGGGGHHVSKAAAAVGGEGESGKEPSNAAAAEGEEEERLEANGKKATTASSRRTLTTTPSSNNKVHHLPRHEPNSKASSEFIKTMLNLCELIRPLQQMDIEEKGEGDDQATPRCRSIKGGLLLTPTRGSSASAGHHESAPQYVKVVADQLWNVLSVAGATNASSSPSTKHGSKRAPSSSSLLVANNQAKRDDAWLAEDNTEDLAPTATTVSVATTEKRASKTSPAIKPTACSTAGIAISPATSAVLNGLRTLHQRLVEALEVDTADLMAEEGGGNAILDGNGNVVSSGGGGGASSLASSSSLHASNSARGGGKRTRSATATTRVASEESSSSESRSSSAENTSDSSDDDDDGESSDDGDGGDDNAAAASSKRTLSTSGKPPNAVSSSVSKRLPPPKASSAAAAGKSSSVVSASSKKSPPPQPKHSKRCAHPVSDGDESDSDVEQIKVEKGNGKRVPAAKKSSPPAAKKSSRAK